jgi:hypothetical protein
MSMGISIHFLGICTHVWWEGMQPRVILTNAREKSHIGDQDTESHIAKLRIAAKDIVNVDSLPWPADSLVWPGTGEAIIEWPLDGVRIRIENGTTPPARDVEHFHCIPSLQHLLGPDIDIGPPSQASVEDGNPELASCIFDVNCGSVSGGALRPDGAVFGMLRTETDGQPRLRIASFGSTTPKVLTLRDGAEVTISNLGATERHDGRFDFYLHYKLAETMPAVLKAPENTGDDCVVNIGAIATWPPGFRSVDAGCSNSTYP